MLRGVFVFVSLLLCTTSAATWDSLDAVLDAGIADHAFPGAVAAVFTQTEIPYFSARGKFTYTFPPPETPGTIPPMTKATVFDMASCTKVVAGTSAVALLYQRGLLDLHAKASRYLPGFEANGKQDITVLHLMLHNAGLPPDPSPNYDTVKFGCPETLKPSPEMKFTCRAKCYKALLEQGLSRAPGDKYVYSDISLMAIMNIVGRVARTAGLVTAADIKRECPLDDAGWEQCYFEAFVRKYVFDALKLSPSTGFMPARATWKGIAPTENETGYRRRVVQGEVHDPNTYAMGGISGHAGLFSTASDLITVGRKWLFAPASSPDFVNRTTATFFTTQYDGTLSSRAIGWNTNSPDAPDHGWNYCCGTLSPKTFMHLGYTGTMMCHDPVRGVGVILLTNRVYPETETTSAKIYAVRKAFSTKVQQIFDSLNH